MWKLYGADQTVAVRSTAQRLFDCTGLWMDLPKLEFGAINLTNVARNGSAGHRDLQQRHQP